VERVTETRLAPDELVKNRNVVASGGKDRGETGCGVLVYLGSVVPLATNFFLLFRMFGPLCLLVWVMDRRRGRGLLGTLGECSVW
jgi:hypothetical protein